MFSILVSIEITTYKYVGMDHMAMITLHYQHSAALQVCWNK
jgi:hypothetical protein